MRKQLRQAILTALGSTALGGISGTASGITPAAVGTFTGSALSYSGSAPYRAWSDYGTGSNYGWTHTAKFLTIQVGTTADIATGKVVDARIDLRGSGAAPMAFPGFSLWTSGNLPVVGGVANGGGYGHAWSQVRGPRDGGVADDPCGLGGDCALGSNGWMGNGGGGNIVDGRNGWIGYANAGYSFTNGDGDKIPGLLPGASNPANAAQYNGGSELTPVNGSSPYVRSGAVALASGEAMLTLYGLKAGYYLLGIGGVCADENQNGQNCNAAPSGGAGRTFTLSVTSPPNTNPRLTSGTTAISVNKGSAPIDLKPYFRVADPDSNQILNWTPKTAPNRGGSLTISSATAASGGSDIAPGGTLTYTPGQAGTEIFSIQVDDGYGGNATRQFTVSVIESAPNALSGSFTGDEGVQWVSFTSDGTTPVTIRSYGYAAGGFDPLLTLFDAWGSLVGKVQPDGFLNDDADNGGACNLAATDPNTGLCLDSLYVGTLPAGKYWLALTQSLNVARGQNVSAGFVWDGQPQASSAGCPQPGSFFDYGCNPRNGAWRLDVLANGSPIGTPESGGFQPSPNSTPGFVGGGRPVSITLRPNSPAYDLKPHLLANDADAGQILVWSAGRPPQHGTLSLSADATAPAGGTGIVPGGTIAHTPTPGYRGPDSLEMRISDGTASATVLVEMSVADDGTGPAAPYANAGADQIAYEARSVTLDGSGSRSSVQNQPTLSYAWTQTAGPSVALQPGANVAQPGFIAPTVAGDTTLSFDLVVTDVNGIQSSADTVNVAVRNIDAHKPTASAGSNTGARGGATLVLDGTASSDPDAGQTETLTYRWTAPAGIALSSAADRKPSFKAPNDNRTLNFQLVVTDTDGNASAPATVTVTVTKANVPPESHASATGGPSVRAGAVKTLDGSASFDADELPSPLTYLWSQTGGPAVSLSSTTAQKPTFTAPPSAAGQTLVFTLKVSDGEADSTSNVAVQVSAENNAPTVKFLTQPVKEGGQMTLNSSVSDPDGDAIASYRWEQVGGTPVALAQIDQPSLSFTAPAVGRSNGELVFSLAAADNFSANAKTTTSLVTVRVDRDPSLLDCSRAYADVASLAPVAPPSPIALGGLVIWPPDKSMKPVSIVGVTGPNPFELIVTGVTSDEPVRDRAAKDTTGPDARIVKGKATRKNPRVDSVNLRAERQLKQKNGAGSGNGRVYGINFRAGDSGQSCTGSVRVEVTAKPGQAAVDDGQKYDALKRR